MVWLAAAALFLAIVGRLADRRDWRTVCRRLALAAVSVSSVAGFGLGLPGLLLFRSLAPRSAEQTTSEAESEPYDFSFGVSSESLGGATRTRPSVNLLVQSCPPGGGRVVAWNSIGAKFRSSGRSVTLEPSRTSPTLFTAVWHRTLTQLACRYSGDGQHVSTARLLSGEKYAN